MTPNHAASLFVGVSRKRATWLGSIVDVMRLRTSSVRPNVARIGLEVR